ncbi:MAG TPA: hypothetical protein VMS18_21515 [Candidatus Binatia bacterium]|nr:hypothetical protein [Candidatus Binatia bacterium]
MSIRMGSLPLAVTRAAGPLHVRIREYEVPTAKSRPHDPALAPHGALSYTRQGASNPGSDWVS